MTIHRKEAGHRPVHDRIHDFGEVEQTLNSNDRRMQASRCMDCGVPFCHWACPLGNKPPEWNDALYKGDWELAYSCSTLPMTFLSSQGASVRLSARRLVCSILWSMSYNQPRE